MDSNSIGKGLLDSWVNLDGRRKSGGALTYGQSGRFIENGLYPGKGFIDDF